LNVELVVGAPAPAFSLVGGGGRIVKLSSLRGRVVVLFFYPEDDTPVCTQQACGFRDEHAGFAAAGALVFGVSPDGADSHERFRAKFTLPFELLSDPENHVARAYGAYGKKLMYGREVMGTIRSSVVIDASGKVAAVFRNVRSEGNGRRTLDAVRKVSSAIP
jgi:peroxiredoxin Q/BCP